MIFNVGIEREDFFRTMYRMLEDNPNDSLAFLKLYLENERYSLNEKKL